MAKISVRGRECDRLSKKTKVGTLGRCHLPWVWLFPCTGRAEVGLEGAGDRLFPLLLSFSHARTVPWDITVEGQCLQATSWQPAPQRCLPSGALICPPGARYPSLPQPDSDPQPGWSCSAILLDRHRQLMVFSLATFCVPQFSSVFMSPVFQLSRLLASFLFLAESQLVPEYTIHLASDFLSYPRQHWPPLCPLPPDTCFWGPLFINTREFSSVMLLDFFYYDNLPMWLYAHFNRRYLHS